MIRTHRVALYPERTISSDEESRADRRTGYADPAVAGVGANVELARSEESGDRVREVERDARAYLDPDDLGDYRPSAGDGLEIVSGDWPSPSKWRILSVEDPGDGDRWDAVVDLEEHESGF